MSTTATGDPTISTGPTPGTAQATLLNLFGDVVHPAVVPVPTAAIIEVMDPLGFSPPAARQAISRCAAAGWISGQRAGRSSTWGLTSAGITLVTEGITRVEQLADPYADWDGRWQILIVTITNQQRSTRDRVYRSLRWDGFGNPLPSVWVSPHPDRRRRTLTVLTELGLDKSTLSFIGEPDDLGLPLEELVQRSWPLDELEARYADLVDRFQAMQPGDAPESLVALLQLDQELQQLLVTDPQLPSELTPGWPGRQDAATLLELRRAWHPAARDHWSKILRRHTTSE